MRKTDKRVCDKFDYKEFGLTDLENQLYTPAAISEKTSQANLLNLHKPNSLRSPIAAPQYGHIGPIP